MKVLDAKIAVIGMGYVGLPLAVEFAKKYQVIGFDINKKRIDRLNDGHDDTLEVDQDNLKSVLREIPVLSTQYNIGLYNTYNPNELDHCNTFIITVPTPTDKHNRPVLIPLEKASETVARYIKKGSTIIYESTVYPGVTEDICVPIIEKVSGLTFNEDFFVGYSPERINPGDRERTVSNILKITSGSTKETAVFVDELYKTIITAGTHCAPSIKVAEAAKVIENSQRDINIAFVNELAKIFNKLGIDTHEVLEAAGTKWNFLPYKPGLVGGHCISVDPYYLAQKAEEAGYHPEIILSGRRLNDGMGVYIGQEVIKCMIRKNLKILNSKVLMLGITFKENCPDIRNTRSIDIYTELQRFNIKADVYDPWADKNEVKREYNLDLIAQPGSDYDAIILTVSHDVFLQLEVSDLVHEGGIIYDVKGLFDKKLVDARL